MAPVKLERIISVSSEDSDFPAENLLKNAYTDKKWKCRTPGEKQISVVIQLEKAVQINAVDVGNYGSAFVEILVGKSSNPEDYKVLVVASSLMTLQEAKLGANLSNVRFFKEDNIDKKIAIEKWDRIKVVCSQPFNKLIQYGLSFLVIHSSSSSDSHKPVAQLGNFLLKKADNSDDSLTGSLFAKRKQTAKEEPKGAAAIRVASTSGVIEKKGSANIGVKSPKNSPSNSVNSNDTELRNKTKTKRDLSPSSSRRKHLNLNGVSSSSSTDRNEKPGGSKRPRDEKKAPTKPRLEKPFYKLLEGVVFAISGFQNPLRGELRGKALDMGAKYRPDWDGTCSHLICAFPNTPKFNQVLGHGKIVKKDWIEACHGTRMRLPWRRFALHPPDKASPESEDEIFEYVARPPSPVDNRRRVSPSRSSGEDTEEEIEKVLKRQRLLTDKTQDNSAPTPINGRIVSDEGESRINPSQDQTGSTGTEERTSGSIITEDLRSLTNNSSRKAEPSSPKKSPSTNNMKNFKKTFKNSVSTKESQSPKKNLKMTKKPASQTILSFSANPWSPAMRKQLKLPPLPPVDPDDVYNLDTEDEDEESDSKKYGLPHLPTFYDGLTFLIGDDITPEESKEIQRYIIAHKGTVHKKGSKGIKYLITNSADEAKELEGSHPNLIAARPGWIWKAHDEERIPPVTHFGLE